MNKKALSIFITLLACTLSAFAAKSERTLTNVLQELRAELLDSYLQRTEAQLLFHEDYNKQHQRMIDVITETNELSLLLYTQEQGRTFDMAYALKKVTSGYNDFNKGRRPYDQIINGLTFEIDRYARLIEALRRLPPEMKQIQMEIVPDSLLYRNDSLDLHISTASSSLEKEIIQIAIKDSASAPFVLDAAGEEYRDSCILYASELLKMYAGHRDSVINDSTHYQEAYLRTKEAYDYAENLYNELSNYIYDNGQKSMIYILADFNNYWDKIKRDLKDIYDYDGLKQAVEDDPEYYNTITGRTEKAYLVIACAIQLGTLFVVWIIMFFICWLLCRFTGLKKYIRPKALPTFSVLVGTVLYFLLFGYFWEGSEYVRAGIKNINTLLWLLIALSGSLLLRVRSRQISHSASLYLPTFFAAVFVIVCRNTFIPDNLLALIFPPMLLIAALLQLSVCLVEHNKATHIDSILGWVSLAIYVISFVYSFFGYTFSTLIFLVWWYFMLAALLSTLCVSDLMERYKEKWLDQRVAAMRKRITYAPGNDGETLLFGATWFYDLIKQVIIPALLFLSLPWSIQMALDMFDMTDLYAQFFHKPLFHLTDDATGELSMKITGISLVYLGILFYVMKYISRLIHAVWQYARYTTFMRKHNRTTVRANEINLSLGNSIISVLVWFFYTAIVVEELNVPTGSLGLIAGGLSAGIGIALKDILNNFIYGIQLMGGRLRVGDWIECDGVRGKVVAINYQCVQIETVDGTEMSFLNASLFGKNFNNLTRNNSYEFTKIVVGVAYGTDIAKVRSVIVEAMQKMRTKDQYGREIVEPSQGVYVVVNDMSDSSVDIAVKQYVLVAERIGYVDHAKEVIYNALNAAGIAIPFPQCDVHLIKDEA